MSAGERATEAARATSEALAAEATLSAYATEQAASDESLDALAREAAQAAALATEAARSAEATIAALATLEAARAAEAAQVAAIATENAASGANALATAQAAANARATELAALQAQQANAQVTATALAVVAANSVLDPNRRTHIIQTDLQGMIDGDEEALQAARQTLGEQLAAYPGNCRAGFVLISGNAPTIEEGIDLARRVEALLREGWPQIFTDTTGFEVFALPNEPPQGLATIDIFFYSGCLPAG
jgi:hypothetical protein